MTDRELKRLSRKELLEMLIAQLEENQKLNARLEELQAQLDNRRIAIRDAGSIAEAAVRLSGVFEAAQEAAEQYLENVRLLSEECGTVRRSRDTLELFRELGIEPPYSPEEGDLG